MSRKITIDLADDVADALAEQARASGMKFFDHCRAKLIEGLTTKVDRVTMDHRAVGDIHRLAPTIPARKTVATTRTVPVEHDDRSLPASPTDDRIDRLEAMMANLTQFLTQHGPVDDGLPEQKPQDANVDTDDMVSRALGEAERQGLMVDRSEPPPASGGVRHVGHRPPMRFSVGNQPRHLADAFRE